MKKWEKPELNILGLSATKCHDNRHDNYCLDVVKCPYCDYYLVVGEKDSSWAHAQLYLHIDRWHTELEIPTPTPDQTPDRS